MNRVFPRSINLCY